MLFIKNGKIFTITGKNLHNGCVLIKDKKIIEINERIEETKLMTVIDAKRSMGNAGYNRSSLSYRIK
ncbi:amidohydrolase [[Clostridium] sordellii]|nr:amidohydrolase [[Clostridium] sordellii] [Paeniclostridium sordellii]CEP39951.1 amidohydrolase [[Clostridium] sordellii] [Paeniclostridium sordellii]CEP96140.1 amidohydrolase [[Clostridium] sordellii] [Paeniclostridium sordellii]CEQ01966.1 amidohydrolase [[Clostridium] sordellii] [Paeniclostridium sordellii]